jgi:hypothetical protein
MELDMKHLAFAAALMASTSALAQTVGVNYTNGDRNSVATQTLDLAHMAASGVRVIRFPLEKWAGSYSYSISLATKAASHGIATHFVVSLYNPDFYPAGTQPRPADPNNSAVYAAYPLSKLVPTQFAQIVATQLNAAAAAGAQIVAVEPGNEINNPAFNGDFAIPGSNMVYGIANLENGTTPEAQAIAAGFVQYAEAVADLRGLTTLPILSAGLSSEGLAGAKIGNGLSAVADADTIEFLNLYGLNQNVNYYGMHLYPSAANVLLWPGQLATEWLPFCSAETPCAITEFGLPLPTPGACPAQDATRAALTQQLLTDLAPYAIIEEAWFDWSSTTYGLYQCGSLTGTAAVLGF